MQTSGISCRENANPQSENLRRQLPINRTRTLPTPMMQCMIAGIGAATTMTTGPRNSMTRLSQPREVADGEMDPF